MFNFKRNTLLFIAKLIFITFIALEFIVPWRLNYNLGIKFGYGIFQGNSVLLGLYIYLFYVLLKLLEGFKVGYHRVNELIVSQIITIILNNFFFYILTSLFFSGFLSLKLLLFIIFLQIITSFIWTYLSNKLYFRTFKATKTLAIYGNKNFNNLLKTLRKRKERFDIQETIHLDDNYEYIFSAIDNYETILVYDIDLSLRNKIMKYCYQHNINIYIVPVISDIVLKSSVEINLFDTMLLFAEANRITIEQRFLKRTIDILVSLIVLIFTSPFSIGIALAIKLEDGGPIFYKQDRLTRDDVVFQVFKFRSMIENNDPTTLASKNDKRITNIGKKLRATRLDELPQFINVLKGDMSIVGPRPEQPEIAKECIKTLPEFAFRTKFKAGITGYAQINGHYTTDLYDKLKLDIMYMENFSILEDLKIMLKTLRVIFIKERSDGYNK